MDLDPGSTEIPNTATKIPLQTNIVDGNVSITSLSAITNTLISINDANFTENNTWVNMGQYSTPRMQHHVVNEELYE